MAANRPKPGPAGTTEQSPRWEGPQENRPRGYLHAKDQPDMDRPSAEHNSEDGTEAEVGKEKEK